MSFGFGVGDFVTVLDLANKIRKDCVGAPSQFMNITDEVRSLAIVIQDAEIVVTQCELNSEQKTELGEIISSCRKILKDLNKTLEKYKELRTDSKDLDETPDKNNKLQSHSENLNKTLDKNNKLQIHSENLNKRVKRAWKRLRWEPDDIRELRDRLTSNVILLNTYIARISGQAAFAAVNLLNQQQNDQDRLGILEWLNPINYTTQQSDFFNQREAGTGQWLLDSPKFLAWLGASKQTLFCPGIPGAGKTYLVSVIVHDLITRFEKDQSIGIAYIYCNFRQQDMQKASDLLANLLGQLVRGLPSPPEDVKSLYKKHKDNHTRPSLEESSKALRSVTAIYSKAFIVIDALDECQVSNMSRSGFLKEIFKLQAETGANIFATSRFIPEIIEKFKESVSLEIRASEDDIRRYMDGHMSDLPSFVENNPKIQEEIKAKIVKAVDGMFLLAQLYLNSLIGKISAKAIYKTLQKLPTGSDAYDHAYKGAMERISRQAKGHEELAKQVLSWITCAKRPLTTFELQQALAVEVGESALDEDNLPQTEDMVSVCAGLVIVDKESNIIRLVHYTTQEYFERTQSYWFSNAETDITAICATYLSFHTFESGFCQTDTELKERLRLNQLYDYAVHNWGIHARKASILCQQVISFLESKHKTEAAAQALLAINSRYENDSQAVPRQMIGLHLAAYFGLPEAATTLIERGQSLDPEDSYGRTPLSYAAENGHDAVVKLLLERGAQLETKDKSGRRPLSIAAWNGHEAVVKLLLGEGAQLETKDEYYRTPLSFATWNRQETVVKLLLEKGANLETKDINGRTALSNAAWNGHEVVVKLLLEKGAELEIKDNNGWAPLSNAAWRGHEAVVKLLLEKGAKLETKDQDGRTPLSNAALNGHEAVVMQLLEKGAQLDNRDINGRTPLSWATKSQDGVQDLNGFSESWSFMSRSVKGVPRTSSQVLRALTWNSPDEISANDINGDGYDIQGINWEAIEATRKEARELRSLLCFNYTDDRESFRLPEGYHISNTECFFQFRRNMRLHVVTVPHFQLRNLLTVASENNIYYAGKSGVHFVDAVFGNAVFGNGTKVMDLANISTLTSGCGVLIAGTLTGEYAMKTLDRSVFNKPLQGSLAGDANGTVNHIHVIRSRSSTNPMAVFSSNDQKIRLLDCYTNTMKTEHEFEWSINCSATSPDGGRRVIVGDSTQIAIVDAESGEVLQKLDGHRDHGFACAWADDGVHIATGNQDMQVLIWDARMLVRPLRNISADMTGVRSLKFSPNGSGKPVLLMAETADIVSVVDAKLFESKQTLDFFGGIGGMDFASGGQDIYIANADKLRGGLMHYERIGPTGHYSI